MQLEYDPNVTTFQALVDVFFDNHMFATNTMRRQYRNIAFYHDEDQKQIIKDKIKQIEESESIVVMTEVKAVSAFYYAEDYHQKYEMRKRDDLAEFFRGRNNMDFTNSPAAAKLNAFVGSALDAEQVLEEFDIFDLTDNQKKELKSILQGKKKKWLW